MAEVDAKISSVVDIGFVDETDPWKLQSRFFPSKVGGRPAWLNLSELPSPKDMECGKCQQTCIFLCQIYAPIETRSDCFHRTLFLFLCRNPLCCSSNNNDSFIVFRSQLRRENEFFPFEPPDDCENWHPECRAEQWVDLCAACGNKGTSQCGRCKKVKYCGRNHQVAHWKDHHKHHCNADSAGDFIGKSSCLLPEFELIVEPEANVEPKHGEQSDDGSDCEDDDDDDAEKDRLEEFEKLAREGKIGTFADDESVNADLLNMATSEEDKVFKTFKMQISQNPGQVLRYQRGGTPLWMIDDHIPADTDLPPCPQCGSKRIFEFQILPQLLNHLSLDDVNQSIDWGILVIYTCESNCSEGPAYKKEFLWKQDITI